MSARTSSVTIGLVQRRDLKPAKALPRAASCLSGATPEVVREGIFQRVTGGAHQRTIRHATRDSLGRVAAR
jgi:hypothetical protein